MQELANVNMIISAPRGRLRPVALVWASDRTSNTWLHLKGRNHVVFISRTKVYCVFLLNKAAALTMQDITPGHQRVTVQLKSVSATKPTYRKQHNEQVEQRLINAFAFYHQKLIFTQTGKESNDKSNYFQLLSRT